MVALDCEMCETAEGVALTRITVVDRRGKVRPRHQQRHSSRWQPFHSAADHQQYWSLHQSRATAPCRRATVGSDGHIDSVSGAAPSLEPSPCRWIFLDPRLSPSLVQVLMDELVRPEAPITDYVTRYSGITAAMMAGVTTSLADVQVVPVAPEAQRAHHKSSAVIRLHLHAAWHAISRSDAGRCVSLSDLKTCLETSCFSSVEPRRHVAASPCKSSCSGLRICCRQAGLLRVDEVLMVRSASDALERDLWYWLQERFLGLVSAETLLVGHALENDLRVLRVLHGRVVDTAILYPHPKARAAWRCGAIHPAVA